ncbi:hypothetical protein QJS04_geneDACA008609 [Acorus gramineus]|uniref:Coiled-coil domain-containing protein R3HCC1L n=1 Tax=Acorus gramineus TaxID=55184 RepID=A0AAV9AIM9_ACOGR|nr:hypothetical protein QJS04_geneDACA008609 [Acorus gramineus]
MEAIDDKWSESVEDLLDRGDSESASALLHSLIAKLDSPSSSSSADLRLAAALSDLAGIYSSRGLSFKADELRVRALLVRARAQRAVVPAPPVLGDSEDPVKGDSDGVRVSASVEGDDDDWEAIADSGSIEVLSSQDEVGVSNLSLEDNEFRTPKRRGRGSFLYGKSGLYSDQPEDLTTDKAEDGVTCEEPEETTEITKSRFGTGHVLVVSEFPPSTRTTELEKMFEGFKDRGVAIRWVNDTVALAVFRTPNIAREACNSIHSPFKVRILDETHNLWSAISKKVNQSDLEPPYPRPKTSASTAQRLIAQGMGQRLFSSSTRSTEFKKQEEARRNRIVTRHILRDDAWGSDDP